jgi:amino acid transporter
VLTIFLIALILYIVLGIIGFVVHGLIWLFFIAAILFVAHLFVMGYRGGRTRTRSRV